MLDGLEVLSSVTWADSQPELKQELLDPTGLLDETEMLV